MSLKVHHLKPAPGSHTPKTRVGRGDGSKGKTAGRGTKGTKARNQVPVGFEGGTTPIHMRLPKLKGFKNRNKVAYQVVNVAQLGALFPDGGTVGRRRAGGRRCGAPGRAGEGARPGRDLGQGRRHRRRVLRQRRGQDRCRRRVGHPALSRRGRTVTRAHRALTVRRPASGRHRRRHRVSPAPGRVRRTSVTQEGPCSARSHRRFARLTCGRNFSSRWPCWPCTGSARRSRPRTPTRRPSTPACRAPRRAARTSTR